LVTNKERNHETHDNGIGGSACAFKHIRDGTEQRRHGWRRFHRGRFCDQRHHDRLIRERKRDGEPAGLDGRSEPHHGPQHDRESVREYAGAQRLAQRIDLDADRTRLWRQPVGDGQAINEKPRLGAGLFVETDLVPRLLFDAFSSGDRH
jgi:hypothetical protein